MKTRGRWFDYDTGTRTIRALATFHPAYLLRSPSYKRHVLAGSARDREGAGAGKDSGFVKARHCERSPDGAKRNPGSSHQRMSRPRISLRSIRATTLRVRASTIRRLNSPAR